MKESNIRGEVYNLLERLWFWPITQTDARTPMSKEVYGLLSALERAAPNQRGLVRALRGALSGVNTPPIGRPDVLVLSPTGRTLVCEVKVFDNPRGEWAACGFDTKKITEQQRNWLRMWKGDSGLAYLALGLVHGLPHRQDLRRMLWLIPWGTYLTFEAQVLACGVATIPLAEVKGMRVALRDAGLWATKMFAPYELSWDNGAWHLPIHHHLAQFVENAGPTYASSLFPDLVPGDQHCKERDLANWRAEWAKET